MENIQSVGSGFAPQPQGPPSGAMSAAPPQEEHKNHDGKLVLGVLAAGAATVGAIALIKNHKAKDAKQLQKGIEEQISKFKTDVFEPLSKLDDKVTNQEYAQKAYEHIAKAKGFEGVVPQNLEMAELSGNMGAHFNYATGTFKMNSEAVQNMSRTDILGLLTHEFDHLHRFGDVARTKGVDKFVETLETGIHKDFAEKMTPLKKNHQGIIDSLKPDEITKEQLVDSLNRQGPGILEKWFPEGVESVSKEKILEKYQGIYDGKPQEVLEQLKLLKYDESMLNQIQESIVNKEFWKTFVEKKGTIKASELGYNLKPFEEAIEKGSLFKANNALTQANGAYDYAKAFEQYLEVPFENIAWKNQVQTSKAYDDFLKEKKIPLGKNTIEDPLEGLEAFKKVDKELLNKFPDEAKRKDEFNRIMKEISEEQQLLAEDKRFTSQKATMEEVLERIKDPKRKGAPPSPPPPNPTGTAGAGSEPPPSPTAGTGPEPPQNPTEGA